MGGARGLLLWGWWYVLSNWIGVQHHAERPRSRGKCWGCFCRFSSGSCLTVDTSRISVEIVSLLSSGGGFFRLGWCRGDMCGGPCWCCSYRGFLWLLWNGWFWCLCWDCVWMWAEEGGLCSPCTWRLLFSWFDVAESVVLSSHGLGVTDGSILVRTVLLTWLYAPSWVEYWFPGEGGLHSPLHGILW